MTAEEKKKEMCFVEAQLPQQKSDGGHPFPAVLCPNQPLDLPRFIEELKHHKAWIEDVVLHRSGAILLRGFPVETPSDFNAVVEAFGHEDLPYVGGLASRTNVIGRVYTANESPPDQKIPFHHEMAHLREFPSKLFFFCEEEPKRGGETPILLSHVLYQRIKEKFPEFVGRLEEHGVIYTRVLEAGFDPSSPVGRGWQLTFSTEDKKTAEGCVICLTLALGWCFAAFVRGREIRRMKENIERGNSFAFICQDISDLEHSAQIRLPRVSVVMPLKGFGEHNLQNWRSQITSLYGGPLEFLFVVEGTEDPAYHAVSVLISEFKDSVDAKIIIAGLSTTCSQKIHNQLAGVENMHKDTKYVLFLDDDVRLHPGSIGALTAEMEKNPEIFIQTGYPLDLPSGSLGSYCIYEYHMPCSMGFATGGRTFFLWGGCMMMHADDFRNDLYGLVSGLRDGGYSDDMTLAAIAGAHKRLITSPPVAIFPHPLASDLSFPRYWNYLRKQTFVLESYMTKVNWMMNRALFSSHCYLSWGFVAPYVMATIHIAAAVRAQFSNYPFKENSCTSGGLLLAGCLATCTIIELFSMWNLTKVEIHLCNMLSPEGPRVSLGSYNWGLIFLAMLVDNFLYPISAIRSHFSQSINWSGVRYYLKNGKINKIERCKESGLNYTDLGGKHLYGKKVCPPKVSFLGSLARSLAHWHQPKKFDG